MSMPTEKMVSYAFAIAERLNISLPDMFDFMSVSNFISANANAYKMAVQSDSIFVTFKQIEQYANRSLSEQFVHFVSSIPDRTNSIYIFYANEEIVYIGKSTNIKERVISSLKERYSVCKEINKVGFIPFKNISDLQMAEPYLISIIKPKLNREFNVEDYPSVFYSEKINDAVKNMIPIEIFD